MKRRSSSHGITAAMVLLAICSSTAFAAQGTPSPTPISFPTTFGSMHFPKEFPAGTTLEITQWSHFVPSYDKWFDGYAEKWGKANNVKVTVNHISLADLNSSLSSAVAARKGSTLYEMLAPPAAFVQGLQPLNKLNTAAAAAFGKRAPVCKHSTYLPAKQEWYAFCTGWVPDPDDYRVSLWTKVGMPHGPSTYAQALKGATEIFKTTGIPVGGGIAPELDSEYFIRSVIWSFGGSIQNAKGRVVFDSPQVIDAVKFMKKWHEQAQTPEVFTWNAASNNEDYIAGRLSLIQNSISFYRSAQKINPKIADDTGFVPGLKGPGGQVHQTAHVYFIYVMPKYVTNATQKQAAEKFLLDYESNYSQATYASKLYDFPAFPKQAPQLFADGGWLSHDPFGSKPADKLEVLRSTEKSTAWLGFPGNANPAISQIYGEHLLPAMLASVVRGAETPKQAVETTTQQIEKIFAKWQKLGFVGARR